MEAGVAVPTLAPSDALEAVLDSVEHTSGGGGAAASEGADAGVGALLVK